MATTNVKMAKTEKIKLGNQLKVDPGRVADRFRTQKIKVTLSMGREYKEYTHSLERVAKERNFHR